MPEEEPLRCGLTKLKVLKMEVLCLDCQHFWGTQTCKAELVLSFHSSGPGLCAWVSSFLPHPLSPMQSPVGDRHGGDLRALQDFTEPPNDLSISVLFAFSWIHFREWKGTLHYGINYDFFEKLKLQNDQA